MDELAGNGLIRRPGVECEDESNAGQCVTRSDDDLLKTYSALFPVKDSVHLDVLLSFNKFATVLQVFKRFPLLKPFQYLFAPLAKVKLFSAMEAATRESVLQRIDQRGSTDHQDYFDHILPADSPTPTDKRELLHIGSVALQVMFAGWGPMSDLFYSAIVLLLQEPACYKILVEEIRGHFEDYDAITPKALAPLQYLHACIEETLRLLPSNNTGLPRISSGAMVDGQHIPKGVRGESITSSWPYLPSSLLC